MIRPFRSDADKLRTRGDMRDAKLVKCAGCAYQWWTPTVGRCPKCRHEGPHEEMFAQELDYTRV